MQSLIPTLIQRATSKAPSFSHQIAFYLIYLGASFFGHWLRVLPNVDIIIWPPNGVAIAVLLSAPKQSWPWWLSVSVLAELTSNFLWFHNAMLPTLGYAGANVLEVTLAGHMLSTYWEGRHSNIGTLRRVFAFLGVGVLVAAAAGATVGSFVSAISGKQAFEVVWPFWWLGDATGILVAAPLGLATISAWQQRRLPSVMQILEVMLIGTVMILLWRLVVALDPSFTFLMFVPILWAAIRFEIVGTALTIMFLIAIVGVLGETSLAEDGKNVLRLHATFQVLVVVLASTGYVLAAAVRQHRKAMSGLAQSKSILEQRVVERTQDIETAQRRFQATFENAAVGMCILETDGTLVKVNVSLAEMLGYKPEEMEGRPIDDFTYPEDLEKSSEARVLLQSKSRDSYAFEKRYRRKDGEIVWGHTSFSCVRDCATGLITFEIKIIQNITARKQAEADRQTLMYEVNHRCKNLLMLIQAIARQTAAKTPDTFIETFERRLHALAANQDLLVKSSWESVDLDGLVRTQLEHFGSRTGDQIVASGPEIRLSARAAQAIGMALHELGTNAAKYGSLSTATGRVNVKWSLDGDQFTMSWLESDGPEVRQTPKSSGFGSTVIDSLISSTLNGQVTIDFDPSGLIWTCCCPMAALRG